MRMIDADALKEDLTRFYDNEVTARELIDEQPTVGGWVSVKDRLPERPPAVYGVLVRREWYLVALESGAVLTISYEFDDERWQTVGSPVTHWMPLPEPPKEESND